MNNNIDFYLGLALCPFIDPEEAWKIIRSVRHIKGLISFRHLRSYNASTSFAHKFNTWYENINFKYHQERLKSEQIKLVIRGNRQYPKLLEEIYSPPPFLFYQGDIGILNDYYDISLAVVGSRKNTIAASKTIDKIVTPLCELNKTIVISGLAYGVDSLAHLCALEGNSKTVAVLGSGLYKENIYPQKNLGLAKRIVNSGGLLLSEFPPYQGPRKKHFPRRNRIVSGIARSLLVVEAQEKSGALITARFACEQNKDIFAVPGSIFCENYKGTNRLIQKGAYPVLDHNDILVHYR